MFALSKPKDSLRQVVTAQRFAVLATRQNEQPYVNLVAFAASDDLLYILSNNKQHTDGVAITEYISGNLGNAVMEHEKEVNYNEVFYDW